MRKGSTGMRCISRRQGRKQDSITEIKLAREIDPRSLIINANIAWCYYLAGDYDKAVGSRKGNASPGSKFWSCLWLLGAGVPWKKGNMPTPLMPAGTLCHLRREMSPGAQNSPQPMGAQAGKRKRKKLFRNLSK